MADSDFQMPTPEEFEQMKKLFAEMMHQNIRISSPELNAMFQEGFRDGFIAGFEEGLAAMRYVYTVTGQEVSKTMQAAEKILAGDIDPSEKSEKPKTTEKNTDFYG